MMCSMMGSSFLLKVLALLSLVLLALMATGSTGATAAEVNRHSDVEELVTPHVMHAIVKEAIKLDEENKGYKVFYAYAKAFPKARPMPRHPDFKAWFQTTPRDEMLLRLAYAKLQSSTDTTGWNIAG